MIQTPTLVDDAAAVIMGIIILGIFIAAFIKAW